MAINWKKQANRKAYLIVRSCNPHIPAWRAFEYIKELESAGHLERAFAWYTEAELRNEEPENSRTNLTAGEHDR